MRIRCAKRNAQATSLVELVMAISILGVMAAALLSSFSYGFIVTQMFRENQRATQILLEKVETLRLYRWDQVNSNGFIPPAFAEAYDPQAPANQQGVVFYGTTARSSFPANTSYSSNLVQFTVTLNWTNASRNLPRSRSITTYIAKDGLQNYVY